MVFSCVLGPGFWLSPERSVVWFWRGTWTAREVCARGPDRRLVGHARAGLVAGIQTHGWCGVRAGGRVSRPLRLGQRRRRSG